MRLLQTIAGGDVGGAEEFFVRLAVAFGRAGVEQLVAMRPNDGRGGRLRQAGVATVELPFGGLLDRRTVPGISAAIDDFGPDIVLSWMSRGASMSARAVSRSARKPVHVARLGGYYDLKYYRGCDALVGNTPDIVRYLVGNGWPEARARYVPNFVSADPAPEVPRADLGVPDDATLVLAAGRLHPNKAFDVLVRAMASLPGAHVALAGDGVEEGALRDLAARLGVTDRLHLLGWRSDVAALMETADILACPSRIEPLGNVVIEAWARGLPVVASRAAGPAWLIRDGADGLLVPLEDADALAAAIRRVADDPALGNRLAEAGRGRFQAEFTEVAVVARYLSLFAELAG